MPLYITRHPPEASSQVAKYQVSIFARTITRDMKVEVTARETIKPISSTPDHLRIFKISLIDQFNPPVNTPVVLFWAGDGSHVAGKAQILKESLSKVLCHFYPLAGRLKDNLFIDCTDEGAEFQEARVNCPLSEFLMQPDWETLSHFFPIQSSEWGSGPLLQVQANFFECGGLALGLRVSHKIIDGTMYSAFVKGWVGSAVGSSDTVALDFCTSSLFPPAYPPPKTLLNAVKLRQKGVTRRFVFDGAKIAALRALAASEAVPKPTRIEAVSALLWKCSAKASRSRLGSNRQTVLTWPVNMRPRFAPPLPEYAFGNVVGPMVAHGGDIVSDLAVLVRRIRETLGNFGQTHMKRVQGEDRAGAIRDSFLFAQELQGNAEEVDWYNHTSWCRFGFYEADFGWGKPVWATMGDLFHVPNMVFFMDAKGDGMEALVSLVVEDMDLFQCDQELLEFASLNPSVLT
ncbi:Vinorine synthase [Bertholletia excelsa]